MKEKLIKALTLGVSSVEKEFGISFPNLKIEVKENKENKFGDYSTNLAMLLSKQLSKSPREIADVLVKGISKNDFIKHVEIVEPGFINFFLSQAFRNEILVKINKEKTKFGCNKVNKNKGHKVLIEYVSSNPTGPLHVGHGRGAAFGSVLSRILKATGYEVDEEYYVNDQGRQIDLLVISVWIRYLQIFNDSIPFPSKCYKGEYVKHLAEELKTANKEDFLLLENRRHIFDQVLSKKSMEEKDLDLLIDKSKEELKENFVKIKTFSLSSILKNIKKDLKNFGVDHNLWFKESSMFKSLKKNNSQVQEVTRLLEKNNFIYEKDGALWFRSTDFGDEKDRVIKKEDGQSTYFASDIAYHTNKFYRGYDKILNIWGSDHHGYFPRVRAAMKALGEDTEKFEVIFIQFANLIRGGKKVSMSTREGEFISLQALTEEVTPEAARFFYINRKSNQHLDFDLDLAKEESKDNPLYYIQYAHARICSVFRKLQENGRSYNESLALQSLEILKGDEENMIQKYLAGYPEVVSRAAANYEPHLLCYYLRQLAGNFHSYYNDEKILVQDESELQAKLFMLLAVKQVIFNGLDLLGIRSPESM